jgi:2-iminobutanoate/2-iminopropanoate deaminase
LEHPETITSANFGLNTHPYSYGKRVRYLPDCDQMIGCGMLGLDPKSMTFLESTTEGQARTAMEAIKLLIEDNGYSINDIYKLRVLLVDIIDLEKVQNIILSFFEKDDRNNGMASVAITYL